jgi:hypothetical protein
MSDDFMRHCGGTLDLKFDLTAGDCLYECITNEFCQKAHWHPAGQIWPSEHELGKSPNCWMWDKDALPCTAAGWTLEASKIGAHPGAQMIRCETGILS